MFTLKRKQAEKRRAVMFRRARVVPHDLDLATRHLAIERQQCQAIARDLEADIVREYVVIGGTQDHDVQTEIERLFAELSDDPVDYVIASSLDRLTRDMDVVGALFRRVAGWGAVLVCNGDQAADLTQRLVLAGTRGRSSDFD